MSSSQDTTQRTATISVLVDNEAGVLARVTGLFSGRGYNIDSLTVAPVDAEGKQSRWADVSRVLSWVDDLPSEPDAAGAPLAALEITEDEGESTE